MPVTSLAFAIKRLKLVHELTIRKTANVNYENRDVLGDRKLLTGGSTISASGHPSGGGAVVVLQILRTRRDDVTKKLRR